MGNLVAAVFVAATGIAALVVVALVASFRRPRWVLFWGPVLGGTLPMCAAALLRTPLSSSALRITAGVLFVCAAAALLRQAQRSRMAASALVVGTVLTAAIGLEGPASRAAEARRRAAHARFVASAAYRDDLEKSLDACVALEDDGTDCFRLALGADDAVAAWAYFSAACGKGRADACEHVALVPEVTAEDRARFTRFVGVRGADLCE